MKLRADPARSRRGNGQKRSDSLQQDSRKASQEIPRAEWIAATIGFALTSATLIFLLYRGVTDGPALPDIVVEAEQVVELSRGYVVQIRAVNRGARTAADVKIEGQLKTGGTVEETAETTFAYLPSRSERRGGLFFSRDPREGQLTLQPKGFERP